MHFGILFLVFSELWYMVVGGMTTLALYTNAVELVSLDPDNNPVPSCLADLNDFPIRMEAAAGFTGEG